ncbi:hypothetical protein [Bradyrhizobium sp. 145]|uniref:hypothetical protein n=1 Tax=Bradyrhizobium sp. 145 TaxID=2782621 RepID=UPI001FF799B1|nr:hypothetical protein [Bradyrhizobium sp. 145]MCK1689084.1 hypothetical protein [Bradyrhizobium sp. 145]
MWLVDDRMPDARQIRTSHHLGGIYASHCRNKAQDGNEGGLGIDEHADQESRHVANEPLHGAAIMEGHCSKMRSVGPLTPLARLSPWIDLVVKLALGEA